MLLDRVNVSLSTVSDLFGKRGTEYLRKLKLPSIAGGILSQDPKLLDVLNKRLKEREKQIETLLRGDPRIQLLRTIPGVEPIFAALIVLEIGDKVGESNTLYAGLKDSSCSQLVNEYGYSIHGVQMAAGHAPLDSVKKYAKVELSPREAILEKKIIKLPNQERIWE